MNHFYCYDEKGLEPFFIPMALSEFSMIIENLYQFSLPEVIRTSKLQRLLSFTQFKI